MQKRKMAYLFMLDINVMDILALQKKTKEEYDVFITLATLGINVENNFSHNYDYVYNFRNEFYARHLQTSSFNVKAEMEALATLGENGEPVLFVVEAVHKKKK